MQASEQCFDTFFFGGFWPHDVVRDAGLGALAGPSEAPPRSDAGEAGAGEIQARWGARRRQQDNHRRDAATAGEASHTVRFGVMVPRGAMRATDASSIPHSTNFQSL